LIPAAVDEIIRLTPVAPIIKRVAVRDTSVNGIEILAGDRVSLAVSVMNRDHDVFDDPDAVDLARDPRATLTFGGGVHGCFGRHLARTELIEFVTVLTAELSDLRPAAAPTWRSVRSFQGPARLPVRFTRRTGSVSRSRRSTRGTGDVSAYKDEPGRKE
jgi:cytochrome P450